MIRDNKICFTIYENNKYNLLFDTEDILAFEKYNVVGIYDGSQMKLYVNGKLKNSLDVEGQISDVYKVPITIGANPERDLIHIAWFKGSIYDCKVYKKALSIEEINKYYTYARQTFNTPGITPTYTYRTTNRILDMDSRKANGGTSVNSGSTATWYDLAQSTNRTLTNFAYDRTSGWDYNGGLIFDGSDDYVTCGKAKNLNGTKALTISATAKPYTNTDSGYIIANVEASGYGIYVDTNMKFRPIIRLTSAGNYKTLESDTIQSDTIYNVIFTFNGTSLRIFVNGKEGTPLNLTSSDTIVDTAVYNTLGGNPYTNNIATQEFFKGVIYDVKIYDAVLTDSEIQQLWEHQNHQYAIQK